MLSEIILFDGGLSTKKSEHLIQKNEGIICQNVDLEKGNLTPLSQLSKVASVDSYHIYPYNDALIYGSNELDDRFFVEYGGNLYWSNKTFGSYGLMRYNGTGTGTQAQAPNPISNISLVTIAECSIADSLGRMTKNADYYYAFTLVDSNGIESTPVIYSTPFTPANSTKLSSKISILKTNINIVIPIGSTMNIYRQGGSNPTFNLIAEGLDASTLIDGDIETSYGTGYYHFRDKIADIDVSRIELTTFDNTPPPAELDMLIENNGTFFGSSGKKVYFSRSGSPEYWGLLDYVTLDKECTGLGKLGENIVAFTKSNSYLISGYSRDTISLQRLPFSQGCNEKRSIVNIGGYLLWASNNGICMFNGSSVEILTKGTLSWDEFGRIGNATYDDFNSTSNKWNNGLGFNITFATGYKDKYYGVYSNGILILDLANGLKVSTINLPDAYSAVVNQDDNLLYITVKNSLTNLFDVYTVSNASDKMVATWKTGKIYTDSNNVRKHFRQVELDGTPLSVKVYVDGKLKHIANSSKFFLPPACIGRTIQFEIDTINEINTMKYQYSDLSA